MYRFWNHVTRPIADLLKPSIIVEVGAGGGVGTKLLAAYAQHKQATLISIDPSPSYDAHVLRSEFGRSIDLRLGESLKVLPALSGYGLVLLDGDHNWYTVFHELAAIAEEGKRSGRFPTTLVHDTDAPYGRRDLYYRPDSIPPAFRQPMVKGRVTATGAVVPLPSAERRFCIAAREGGPKNGVRTAVEDFVASHPEISVTFLPGIYGLAILVDERTKKEFPALAEFLAGFALTPRMAEHLERVEASRHVLFDETVEAAGLLKDHRIRAAEDRAAWDRERRTLEMRSASTGQIVGTLVSACLYPFFLCIRWLWTAAGKPFPQAARHLRHELLGALLPPPRA